MNEEDSKYTKNLVDKFKQSSSSPTDSDRLENIFNIMTSNQEGLHIYLSKVKDNDSISTGEMSIDQYKAYINKKIYNVPIHYTQEQVDHTIHITEDGILAMKESPKYEQYILESVVETLEHSLQYPFAEHCLLYFAARKEECYGMSWGPIENIYNRKENKQDHYWERKTERKKKEKKRLHIQGEKEKLKERYRELLVKEKGITQQLRRQGEFLSLDKEVKRTRPTVKTVNSAKLARAFYAYNIVL